MQTEPQKKNGAAAPLQAEAPPTAAEKFKAAKEAKRAAKVAKKETAKPEEKLSEADKNLWLLNAECLERHSSELKAARLAVAHAELKLKVAQDQYNKSMGELFSRYDMSPEDGADLNTGVIKRK